MEEGEFEATYVRGATPSEGLILDITVFYPEHKVVDKEDGSFDFHDNFIFSEIMNRRRVVNFNCYDRNNLAKFVTTGHLLKSKLFNSQVSISIPEAKIPKELFKSMHEKTIVTKQITKIPMRIVSDGRKAYIRFEKE